MGLIRPKEWLHLPAPALVDRIVTEIQADPELRAYLGMRCGYAPDMLAMSVAGFTLAEVSALYRESLARVVSEAGAEAVDTAVPHLARERGEDGTSRVRIVEAAFDFVRCSTACRWRRVRLSPPPPTRRGSKIESWQRSPAAWSTMTPPATRRSTPCQIACLLSRCASVLARPSAAQVLSACSPSTLRGRSPPMPYGARSLHRPA